MHIMTILKLNRPTYLDETRAVPYNRNNFDNTFYNIESRYNPHGYSSAPNA